MRGFTLLDLMLGVAISGILAVIAVPLYNSYIDRAQNRAAMADIAWLDMQIEKYSAINFALPDTLTQLPPGPRMDPWDQDYVYLRIEGSGTKGIQGQVRKDQALNPINSDFDLYSLGKDGGSSKPLTATASRDDIVRAGNGGFIGIAEDF